MPIRVTVEAVPGGNEARKNTIAVMNIENDAKGTNIYGNYKVRTMLAKDGPFISDEELIEGVDRHDDGNIFNFLERLLTQRKQK